MAQQLVFFNIFSRNTLEKISQIVQFFHSHAYGSIPHRRHILFLLHWISSIGISILV